jgi:hypothetical protein
LTDEDKKILEAWSHGMAGANSRLAKRAWWVLEDNARRPPTELTGAWANISEAHRWIFNYHTMGVIGLIDAPRSGRPMLHHESVASAKEKIEYYRSKSDGNNEEIVCVLHTLTQQEREAFWRTNRSSGSTLLRKRRGVDLPIPVPSGLSDLICVHLGVTVKIISYLPSSERHFSELNGTWLNVPDLTQLIRKTESKRSNLLQALAASATQSKNGKQKTNAEINKMIKHENAVERRVLDHLETFAKNFKNSLVVHLAFDLQHGLDALRAMKGMRSRYLWPAASSKSEGLLKELKILPYQGSHSQILLSSLRGYFHTHRDDPIKQLHDNLTCERENVFSWIRASDKEDNESISNWLQSDPLNPNDFNELQQY